MSAKDTKTKILDVAEKLFAENGLQATSLRQIINEAGVNVASVHYHFGSKDVVVREILVRRFRPINEKKLQRLDELENEKDDPLPLDLLILAFVEPNIRTSFGDKTQMKLIFKLLAELENVVGKIELPPDNLFAKVVERFMAALQKTLPHLSVSELKWRFKFMLGAMHFILMQQSMPKNFPLRDDDMDTDQVVDYLVTFLKAGFLAPAVKKQKRKNA